MNQIPPSLPFATPTAGTSAPQGVIPSPPPGLAQLAAGTIIEGTVIGRTAPGQVAVQTSHGELAVRTAAALPAQARVVLQLQATGSQVRVIVLAVEPAGSAPQGTQAQAQVTSQPGTPAGGQAAGPAGGPPAQGAPPGAVVTGSAAAGAPAAGVPVGAPATVTGTAAATSAQPATPATQGTPPTGAQSAAAPQAPAAAGTPQATGGPLIQNVAATSIPVAAQTHGAQGTTAQAPGPSAVGPAATGASTAGALPLPGQATAAIGSGQLATPPGITPQLAPIVGEGAKLARAWPALQTAIDALRQTGNPAVAAALDAVIPRPAGQAGAQFGSAVVFLMAALKGGDLRSWLGEDAARELARLKGGQALKGLADDFAELSRLARNEAGEWKIYALPFQDGAETRPMQLYVKRRRSNDGDAEGDDPARFVFDIDLSRLGPLQLEGLAGRGRFDLVIRSKQPLDAEIRSTVNGLFAQARELGTFAGEVHFQTVGSFPIAPLGDAHALDAGLVV